MKTSRAIVFGILLSGCGSDFDDPIALDTEIPVEYVNVAAPSDLVALLNGGDDWSALESIEPVTPQLDKTSFGYGGGEYSGGAIANGLYHLVEFKIQQREINLRSERRYVEDAQQKVSTVYRRTLQIEDVPRKSAEGGNAKSIIETTSVVAVGDWLVRFCRFFRCIPTPDPFRTRASQVLTRSKRNGDAVIAEHFGDAQPESRAVSFTADPNRLIIAYNTNPYTREVYTYSRQTPATESGVQ